MSFHCWEGTQLQKIIYFSVTNNSTVVRCPETYSFLLPSFLDGMKKKNQNILLSFPVYIHLTSTKREIDLVFTTANRGLNPFLPKPTWNIKVSQIECTDSTAAPTSCLQYFTAKSGVIESFNFNNGLGPYPGNMQYAICLHKPQPVVRMR